MFLVAAFIAYLIAALIFIGIAVGPIDTDPEKWRDVGFFLVASGLALSLVTGAVAVVRRE